MRDMNRKGWPGGNSRQGENYALNTLGLLWEPISENTLFSLPKLVPQKWIGY
jgi:hypothetical protein